jgi:hypothetical protein
VVRTIALAATSQSRGLVAWSIAAAPNKIVIEMVPAIV